MQGSKGKLETMQWDHENHARNQFPHSLMKNMQKQLVATDENGTEALKSIHKVVSEGYKDVIIKGRNGVNDTLLRR